MMDTFAKAVFKKLQESFPGMITADNPEQSALLIDMPAENGAPIGGLVIQTTAEKAIWLRNYHPCSAGLMDDVDQLISTMKAVFADQLLWAIGYEAGEWVETRLYNKGEPLAAEAGVSYKILSWSGSYDQGVDLP